MLPPTTAANTARIASHGKMLNAPTLPPAANEPRRVQELANCFAALTELNYFSSPNAVFSARYELGEVRRTEPLFTCKGPPVHRCSMREPNEFVE